MALARLYKATRSLSQVSRRVSLRPAFQHRGRRAARVGGLRPRSRLWLPVEPCRAGDPLCMLGGVRRRFGGRRPRRAQSALRCERMIVTITLNFIVLAFLNWIVATKLHVAELLHTPEIHAGGVPRLSDAIPAFHGSAANFIVLLAIAAALFVGWYLFRTREGYELRAVGLQPPAAEYGGVKVGRIWFRALLLSGALAGLGGTNYVLGYNSTQEDSPPGAATSAIAVALVGRNHQVGVSLRCTPLATLSQGG